MPKVLKNAKQVRPRKKAVRSDTAHLDELIAEATVDCYNESEEVTGIFTMLEENLAGPFSTTLLEVEVTVERVDQVVSFYDGPNVCTDDDLRRMDGYRTELGKRFCRRCEYCQPCPNGVMITMAMGYPVVTARMGAAVARQFCKAAMESVLQCTECGECLPRCPYELPIPEMLKSHYGAYLRDCGPPTPSEG